MSYGCLYKSVILFTDNCGTSCLRFVLDYLSMTYPGIGKYVLMMAIQGLVYLLLVTMAELNFFFWVMYKLRGKAAHTAQVDSERDNVLEEDEDVVNERKRINGNEIDTLQGKDALILKNLSKYYGNFQAVKGVSIGVPRQECFGLLGQNGAGKTTTFKMMTGDEIVTGGNAYLDRYDVKNHIKEVCLITIKKVEIKNEIKIKNKGRIYELKLVFSPA